MILDSELRAHHRQQRGPKGAEGVEGFGSGPLSSSLLPLPPSQDRSRPNPSQLRVR